MSRLKPLGLSPRVFAQQYAAEFGEVVGIGIIVEDANNGFPVDRLEAEHARFAVVVRVVRRLVVRPGVV